MQAKYVTKGKTFEKHMEEDFFKYYKRIPLWNVSVQNLMQKRGAKPELINST